MPRMLDAAKDQLRKAMGKRPTSPTKFKVISRQFGGKRNPMTVVDRKTGFKVIQHKRSD